MVLVDIYVPSTDREYNFQLEQNATVHAVIEELIELIAQKEKCSFQGSSSQMTLCSRDSQSILDKGKTLAQCGIKTGSRLIFV